MCIGTCSAKLFCRLRGCLQGLAITTRRAMPSPTHIRLAIMTRLFTQAFQPDSHRVALLKCYTSHGVQNITSQAWMKARLHSGSVATFSWLGMQTLQIVIPRTGQNLAKYSTSKDHASCKSSFIWCDMQRPPQWETLPASGQIIMTT